MATIDDRAVVDKIIAANGRLYDDGPAVSKIVEYTNAWGNKAYGLVFENEIDQDRYERPTEYVGKPRVIFERTVSKR